MLKNMRLLKSLLIYRQKGDIIEISIRDYGPGISDNLLQKIMEPYVRGINLKKSGFGLGLSICKRVMGAHQGGIKVKNNVDIGATFIVQWDNNKVGLC